MTDACKHKVLLAEHVLRPRQLTAAHELPALPGPLLPLLLRHPLLLPAASTGHPWMQQILQRQLLCPSYQACITEAAHMLIHRLVCTISTACLAAIALPGWISNTVAITRPARSKTKTDRDALRMSRSLKFYGKRNCGCCKS
jgi:hypothetical protein